MGKYDKLFTDILSGRSDQSIRFTELTHLLCAMGFNERINGGHAKVPPNSPSVPDCGYTIYRGSCKCSGVAGAGRLKK